jgi:hypothetical protein
MNVGNLALLVVFGVVLVLYMSRRRKRLGQED